MTDPAQSPTGDPVTPDEVDLMGESARIRRAGQAKIKHALDLYDAARQTLAAELQEDAGPFLDRMFVAVRPIIEAYQRDLSEAFRLYTAVRDQTASEVEEATRKLRDDHAARMAGVNADRPSCADCGSHRLTPAGCLNCMYPAGGQRPAPRRQRGVQS